METTRSTSGLTAGGAMVEGRAGIANAGAGAGWQWAAQGPPQLILLVHYMQQDAIESDPDALASQRQASTDLSAADADPAVAVDDPVHLHRQQVRRHEGQRGRAGGSATVREEASEIPLRQPGRAGLDAGAVGGQYVQSIGVDPDRDRGAGEGGSEPHLLLGDGQVPRRRYDPDQLHGLGAAGGHGDRCGVDLDG